MLAFALSKRISAKDMLREAVMTLQRAHIETASLDARLLLEHALGLSREQLLLAIDQPVEEWQESHYRELITKRVDRQPVAQLIGKREFWGMVFEVSCNTLDPRADSETLVQGVLKEHARRDRPVRILDLGTGTGCLLLSLLSELPSATGIGADICDKALAIAKNNAQALDIQARAQFIASNWFENIDGTFDIIISNPPYIATQDIENCPPEVARHEPKLALDGGADGLDCYRAIIGALPRFLAKDGIVALEMGMGQQPALESLAAANGLHVHSVKQDIQGLPRCILLKHPIQPLRTE